MYSTPLIASSSGVATVCASTVGFAPGYTARTAIAGGATSGYSLTGSAKIDSSPAARTESDNTTAKIGRSMKNREKRTRESSMFCRSERSEEPQGVPAEGSTGRIAIPRLPARDDLARCEGSRVGHRRPLGQHLHAGPNAEQPVDDHILAGRQPGIHDPQPVDETA